MSSEPAHVEVNIKAINQCLQRRTINGAGASVMQRLAVTNAFGSAKKMPFASGGVRQFMSRSAD